LIVILNLQLRISENFSLGRPKALVHRSGVTALSGIPEVDALTIKKGEPGISSPSMTGC